MRFLRNTFLLVLATLAIAPAARAATVVTTTADGGAGSLREVVAEAKADETIVVPTGTYKLTLGELVIAVPLSLVGSGPGATVIEGGGSTRVLKTTAAGELRLEHLTIRGGREKESVASGAGILATDGHLVLRDVNLADNVADATAPGKHGGIAEGGGLTARLDANVRVTILESTFSGNVVDASGSDGEGGGLAEGGAINMADAGALAISDSTFVGNKAVSRGRGGTAHGGALYIRHNGEPGSLTDSTIAENFVESGDLALGGGIWVGGGLKGFEIDGVTIAENKVHSTKGSGAGGGLEGSGLEGAPLLVVGSTIVGNWADHGGNVQIGDATQFADTVLSGGVGAPGEENCSTASRIVSLGFNLESLDQCDLGAPGDVVATDPQLGPLADNGGPTATMLPAQTSPLVDAGASFGLATDQRGLPRPVDDPRIANSIAPGADGADIGAVELPAQPAPPPPPPAPEQPAPPASGAGTGSGDGPATPSLRMGRLAKDPKAGTATLSVAFDRPATGTLVLSGKGLKARSRTLSGATAARLLVAPTGTTRRALIEKGSRRVGLVVTFKAAGADLRRAERAATLTYRPRR